MAADLKHDEPLQGGEDSEAPESNTVQELGQEKVGFDPLASPAPDGGLKAWLVAAGGFCLFFCCLGFANSFGTFAEFYLSNQLRGESPDNIAWVGSVSAFLQFAFGGIAGPLFDRYGEKVLRPYPT